MDIQVAVSGRLNHWQWARAARNFLRHRDLLWQMVSTDLRGRYVGSTLGIFWSVIHPLMLISIYTLIFSHVMQTRLAGASGPYDYSVYLCAGLLPWVAFQEILTRCTSVFLDQANLVKKVAFPKTLLHGYVLGAAGINLVLMLVIFFFFLLLIGYPLAWSSCLWPLFILFQLFFATGLGFFTSVLNVFFRDTAQIVSVFLQFWFWLTPIVYPPEVLPEGFAFLLAFNPLYHFVHVHQRLVLTGQLPSGLETAFLVGLSLVVLLGGVAFFRLLRYRIPDEL
jgi:lipopolysaccharide transport system permease protein